ncbi:hypothetical protein ALQ72_05242 [Pseudomonas syringae pv. maculicola]|uniref:hypothetical protein n=1 Tax=Pseudomonas syringae group genomosp. 3 TaxID=251701 RepID=UPI0006B9ABD1|nr:hypothetical protein [Pseudomonas syringae group genomosp. 3]MBM0208365.1 hypothetical protein [Pseudomonas syringae pv. maculicola]RMM72602.1 hypothetical protein ALQ72_05242 [Pseudomonas syringae pv. maculicola]
MARVNQQKKDRVLAEWAKWEEQAKAQGMQPNQTAFVTASKGTFWETNMSTLRNYIGKNPERRVGASPKQAKVFVTPSSSPNAILKQIQELQAAYRQSLANRVQELEEGIARMQEELQQVREELERGVQGE